MGPPDFGGPLVTFWLAAGPFGGKPKVWKFVGQVRKSDLGGFLFQRHQAQKPPISG